MWYHPWCACVCRKSDISMGLFTSDKSPSYMGGRNVKELLQLHWTDIKK